MEIIKNLKNGVVHGIGIALVIGLVGASYAAWTSLPTETDGQTLTSTKWNSVIDRLNSIDEKSLATAWVNFNGINCIGGAGNECVIGDSYNISKVVRISAGSYDVYFANNMNNINYTPMVTTTQTYSTASLGTEADATQQGTVSNTLASFHVKLLYPHTNARYDAGGVFVQVFGGK